MSEKTFGGSVKEKEKMATTVDYLIIIMSIYGIPACVPARWLSWAHHWSSIPRTHVKVKGDNSTTLFFDFHMHTAHTHTHTEHGNMCTHIF